MTSHHIPQLTWQDVGERLDAGAVVLLPIGANEGHGHHLPLATDTLIATHVCEEVAERVDALIAPAVPWGYKSQMRTGGGHHRTGNIGLWADTLASLVSEVIVDLIEKGVRRAALINGHYENTWFLVEACHRAVREAGLAEGELRILSTAWWDVTDAEMLDACFPQPPKAIEYEHGALLETSIMLHIHPELVHMDRLPHHEFDRFPPYDIYPPDLSWANETGVLAPVDGASAESGARLMTMVADRIADAVATELGAGKRR